MLKKIFCRKVLNMLFNILCYSCVFTIVSLLFDSFYIDNSYHGLYIFISSFIIFILNKTIKPVLFCITLPLTAISFGFFYPFINVIILFITSFIMGDRFIIHGIFMYFIIAIFISVLYLIIEGFLIKPIVRRIKL